MSVNNYQTFKVLQVISPDGGGPQKPPDVPTSVSIYHKHDTKFGIHTVKTKVKFGKFTYDLFGLYVDRDNHNLIIQVISHPHNQFIHETRIYTDYFPKE